MSHKKSNQKSKHNREERSEISIIWENQVQKKKDGNLVSFPMTREAIYQEKVINTHGVKIRIVSSGFGIKSTHTLQNMFAA